MGSARGTGWPETSGRTPRRWFHLRRAVWTLARKEKTNSLADVKLAPNEATQVAMLGHIAPVYNYAQRPLCVFGHFTIINSFTRR